MDIGAQLPGQVITTNARLLVVRRKEFGTWLPQKTSLQD
jgi:hypothetical protein